MLIQPVEYSLVVWFAPAAASTDFVEWNHDTTNNNVEMSGGGGLMMMIEVA